jgi:hypothetical protein
MGACDSARPQWGADAEAYVAGLHSAWESGSPNADQFLAPEGQVDYYGIAVTLAFGRAGLVPFLDDWDPHTEVDEPVYLAVDGAIDPSRLEWPGYVVPQAPVYRIGAAGITSLVWHGSRDSGIEYVGYNPDGEDEFQERYLQAWSQADPDAVNALYSPAAAVTDSLLGVSLITPEQRRQAATGDPGGGGLPGATLHEIPMDGGVARYGKSRSGFGPSSVVLLLQVGGEDGCPGALGVALTLDSERRITHEERYHRVDSVRACMDTDALPPGWWDSVAVPAPEAFTVTGTIPVAGAQTTIFNGTPQREDLLRWALQRFADAVLPSPSPSSVTFAPPVADPWTAYAVVPGAPDLVLPSTAPDCPSEGCAVWPTPARVSALTALAHRWVAAAAAPRGLADMAAAHGLVFDWPPAAESQAALDLAAAIVAWGLMDQPYDQPEVLAGLSCEELAADFATITMVSTTPGAACAQSQR